MPEQRSQVLVIDDDPVIRRLIVTVSRQAGYVTSEATNGAEALEMVERGEFTLLILDLMLPGVSGHDVLDRLDPAHECSVIIVTASDDHDVQRIDSRLVCDIVRKPFDIHRLERAITAAFESGTPKYGDAAGGRLRLRPDGADAAGSERQFSGGATPDEERIGMDAPIPDDEPAAD